MKWINVSGQLQSHGRNEGALLTGDWAISTAGLKLLVLLGNEALLSFLHAATHCMILL
jgi:hypothetical protein